MGKSNKEVLFSNAFNPLDSESLFQKSNNSKRSGDAIQAIKIKAVLLNFNLFKKIKLNTPNKIINSVQGFLKIIKIAITHKKTLNILLKFFSERFII